MTHPFRRKTNAADTVKKARTLADYVLAGVKITSGLTIGVGLTLHGVAVVRAQVHFEPRLQAVTEKADQLEGQVKTLDQRYVLKADVEARRTQREKREAENDQRLARVENKLDQIDTAITVLATSRQ